MRFIFAFVFFLLVSTCAQAQFPSEFWHEGKMVIISGDTLKGLIKYDLETDIVQFSKDKQTIKTYSARKLLFFQIFDETANTFRRFYVLPYNLNGNYEVPLIFELIYEGRTLTLLSREAIEYVVRNYPYAVSGSYTRLELVYTHYFLTDEGKIIKFTGKKRDLLQVMNKRGAEIRKFLKNNRVKPERRADLVKTVSYYNSLFN